MKRPRDPNQLAKLIVDIATGQVKDTVSEEKRTPKSKRGQAGGLKGGKARASKLSRNRRKAIALKAAQSRWRNSR
jgi:hypothetical protein